MRAMVLGVTGVVGSLLYSDLLNDSQFEEVITLSRSEVEGHIKATNYIISFDNLSDLAELFEVDVVFCALGTTKAKAGNKEAFRKVDYDYPLEAAKLLKNKNSNGIFVVITAIGAQENSRVFYNKVKGELEASLLEVNLSLLVLVRPSLILGDRNDTRIIERIAQLIAQTLDPILSRVFPKYAAVKAVKISKVMIKACKDVKGKVRVILSDEIKNYSDLLS